MRILGIIQDILQCCVVFESDLRFCSVLAGFWFERISPKRIDNFLSTNHSQNDENSFFKTLYFFKIAILIKDKGSSASWYDPVFV